MKLVMATGITDLSKCVQILRQDDFTIVGVLESGKSINIVSSTDVSAVDDVWYAIRYRYSGSIDDVDPFVLAD